MSTHDSPASLAAPGAVAYPPASLADPSAIAHLPAALAAPSGAAGDYWRGGLAAGVHAPLPRGAHERAGHPPGKFVADRLFMPPRPQVEVEPRIYTMRELNQHTAKVMGEIEKSGVPAFVTKHGRFVAMITPLAA